MRYHPEDKEKTRQRILSVASRRYRLEGINAVGIANLMADLSMTHGGFYAHFADKEALVAEVCDYAFSAWRKRWQALRHGPSAFVALVKDYLSRGHHDHPETGCLAAALAGEMARRDSRSRKAFTHGIEAMLQQLATLDDRPTEMSPEANLSLLVGAMMLSRAVSDPELSDRFRHQALAALTDRQADQP